MGIIRSTNNGYRDCIDALSKKASTTTGMLCGHFKRLSCNSYGMPYSHMYFLCSCIAALPGAQIYNLTLVLERIQRHFTKRIYGLHDLSYNDRLQSLGTLSLRTRKLYADMIIIYKALHGLRDINPTDIGLSIISSSTTGAGIKISQQLIRSKYHASYFVCRALVEWNGLSIRIINCRTLSSFKKQLYSYFLNKTI